MSENKKDDKERKGVGAGVGGGGGAAPQWMSTAARVGSNSSPGSFISGAAGNAGLLMKVKSVLMSKALLFLTATGGMVMGGSGLADMNQRGFGVEAGGGNVSAFDSRGRGAGSTAALPGAEPEGKSALELAQQANEGAYGEPVAASADAPAADANAEEEEVPEAGAAAGMDPGAMAQGMMAGAMGADESSKAKDGLAKKFGGLSSNIGGGGTTAKLSGGPGLAGGINKNFAQGSTLSNKRLTAMASGRKAGVSRAMTPAQTTGGKHRMGANATKLSKMNQAMSGARDQGAASQSAIHASEWSGADPGGQTLTGGGAGAAGFDDNEGSGGGGPMGSGSSSGGSYNDGYNDGYGDGGYDTAPPGGNVTPYQQMVDMAQAMIMLASILLLIAGLFGLWAKHVAATAAGPQAPAQLAFAATLYKIAKFMAYAAMACAAIATLSGLGIMMQGQTTQGAIFTGVGALLTILSYIAADDYGKASTGSQQASTEAGKVAAKDAGLKSITSEGLGKAIGTEGAKGLATASSTGGIGSTGGLAMGGGAVGAGADGGMMANADGFEGDYNEKQGLNRDGSVKEPKG